MRHPSLNKLRAFDAAARHLNFRLAAEELNLTQGAVAQQVRALEDELEVPLFDRLPRGLALTGPAEGFHAQVRRGLDEIDRAIIDISQQVPRITLSLPPSFAAQWLVPRLPGFLDKNPGLDLATLATERLATFKGDGVDLAIRIGTPPFPGLKSHFLAAIRLVAVASPVLTGNRKTIENIQDMPHLRILLDSHTSWEEVLGTQLLPEDVTYLSFSHSSLAINAALEGQGIALVPELLVQRQLTNGALTCLWRQPDQGTGTRGYHLVYPENPVRFGEARQKVIDWICREFGKDWPA
jgi:LysR family glycine cleavage system transcriptional activator